MKKIILLLMLSVLSSNSFADITNFKIATWNMQGSGGSVKWAISLLNAILHSGGQGAPDIVTIQEGGAGPGWYDGAHYRTIRGVTQLPEPGSSASTLPLTTEGFIGGFHPEVVEFRWYVSRNSNPYYVYGVISDVQNHRPGRVNNYIVSRQRAQEVLLFAHRQNTPCSETSVRPNFGIRIGTSYFFNIHSISGPAGAADSAWRLNQINTFVRNQGFGYDWAAIGDFNANPSAVRREVDRQQENISLYPDIRHLLAYVSTGQITQTSGNELDFMVYRRPTVSTVNHIPAFTFIALLISMYDSDHFPIKFY